MSDSCAAQLGLPTGSSDAAGCGNNTAQRWVAVGMVSCCIGVGISVNILQCSLPGCWLAAAHNPNKRSRLWHVSPRHPE